MNAESIKMVKVILLFITSMVCYAQADPFPPHHRNPEQDYIRPSSQGGRPRPRPQPNFNPFDNEPIRFQEENHGSSSNPIQVAYSWKQVDFEFENDRMRENMIQKQQFIPKNNLILDVDVYDDGYPNHLKVFVTLPRVRPGVPVTLATVSQYRRNNANLLAPFPDWRSNLAPLSGDCDNGITSVFRTHMDDCGRLWVLDSGNNNAFAGASSRIVCQPKVLIYDIKNNNQLIGKYTIPNSMIETNSLFVTIAVDTRRQDCNDAFAYIADSIGYKMIVFNLRTGAFWRINSILFFPYPDWSRFTINGLSFDLSGGIFGLALGPLFKGNRRLLYFHSIDSVKQSWTDTGDLRNQTLWKDNMNAKPRAFNLFNGTRSSQSAAATMNEDGVMFFGLVATNEIACWNSRQKFEQRNIIKLARDDTTLQFNSGIKVYRGKLYAVTSRLQKYLNNQVNENEENYRVMIGDVNRMTQGTKCHVNTLDRNNFDMEYSPDEESGDFPLDNELSYPSN